MIVVLLLLSIFGQERIYITEHVDHIEINEFYNSSTFSRNFAQVIFWEWSPELSTFVVREWALLDDAKMSDDELQLKTKEEEALAIKEKRRPFPVIYDLKPHQITPNIDGNGRKYILWNRKHTGDFFKIYYTKMYYTKTIEDRELDNRDILERSMRRPLGTVAYPEFPY